MRTDTVFECSPDGSAVRRNQASQYRETLDLHRAGGEAGRTDTLHAGDLHDALLLRRATDSLVRSGGADPRWTDRAIDAGSRQRTWHGEDRKSVVEGKSVEVDRRGDDDRTTVL